MRWPGGLSAFAGVPPNGFGGSATPRSGGAGRATAAVADPFGFGAAAPFGFTGVAVGVVAGAVSAAVVVTTGATAGGGSGAATGGDAAAPVAPVAPEDAPACEFAFAFVAGCTAARGESSDVPKITSTDVPTTTQRPTSTKHTRMATLAFALTDLLDTESENETIEG